MVGEKKSVIVGTGGGRQRLKEIKDLSLLLLSPPPRRRTRGKIIANSITTISIVPKIKQRMIHFQNFHDEVSFMLIALLSASIWLLMLIEK